jgi:hypothetical protein
MNIRLGGLGWYMTYQQKTNHFDFLCTPTEPNYGLLYRLYRCHISLCIIIVASLLFLFPFFHLLYVIFFYSNSWGKKRYQRILTFFFLFEAMPSIGVI